MTEWIDKPAWGRTRCVIDTPFYSRHELQVERGGACSLHYHLSRANRFVCKSGRVLIAQFYGPRIDKVVLTKDNVYDVPSLVPHLFTVLDSGEMVEEYYPDRGGIVDNADIVRIVTGSRTDDPEGVPERLLRELVSTE